MHDLIINVQPHTYYHWMLRQNNLYCWIRLIIYQHSPQINTYWMLMQNHANCLLCLSISNLTYPFIVTKCWDAKQCSLFKLFSNIQPYKYILNVDAKQSMLICINIQLQGPDVWGWILTHKLNHLLWFVSIFNKCTCEGKCF